MNDKNTAAMEKKPYVTVRSAFIPLHLDENIAASGHPSEPDKPEEPEKPAFKPFFIIPTDEDVIGF